jgi:hypothetical protein
MRSTSTFQQYIGRPSRSYRRNVANGASDARENTGWRAVRSPDRRGAKILGISHGESRKRTPTVLPLIADGHSLGWNVRLSCFALFPLEGGKTSIVSIQTCIVQKEGENPLNSWPLALATANGKGMSFTNNYARGEDSRNSRRPKSVGGAPSQSDRPASEAD